jgi:CBS domain containing-hemolysin-like protein
VRGAELLFAPAVWIGEQADALMLRLVPRKTQDAGEREVSTEQFRQVVTAEADVTREEQHLLAGVFSLGDTDVREIMVPRVDILGVEQTTPWSEVVDRVRSAGHARLPVYDQTIDEVVGVLYAKDLLPAVIDDAPPADGWTSLVRPAVFIPTTKRIDAQLRDFQASRNHIAIVVDEYGGTAGLVTIEDVLEEIVGEIRDEHDDEEKPVEQRDGRRFWVSARLTLDELSEVLGDDFAHEDVTTVGGLIYELLGRVPRAGEELTLHGFRVVVERVVRRRVERVYFERLAPALIPAEDK